MQAITTVGLDIAESVFQVHAIDAEGNVIVRRQLKRRGVLAFFSEAACCQLYRSFNLNLFVKQFKSRST